MKLRTKFTLASLIVLALLIILVNGSVFLLLRANDEVAARHTIAVNLIRTLYDVRGSGLAVNDEVNDLLRHGFNDNDFGQLRTAINRYDQSLTKLESLMPTAPELAMLQNGHQMITALLAEINAQLSTDSREPALVHLAISASLRERADELDDWGEGLEEHILRLIDEAEYQESLAIEHAERLGGFIRIEALAIFGVIALVIAGQFVVILRPLIRAIEQLVFGAAEIGKGNLDYRLDIQTRDEIERLGQAFNHMASNLGSSYRSLEVTSQALKDELEKGRQLQQDFLPHSLPQPPGWEFAASLKPARVVSGDFYDAFELPGGTVAFAIGDVCDKGVGSALFMALCRSLLRIFLRHNYSDALTGQRVGQSGNPEQHAGQLSGDDSGSTNLLYTVEYTNSYIAHTHSHTNMFTTLFFGILDPATGALIYINGGHEPPVILGPEGVKARLTATGPAVGLFPDIGFDVGQTRFEAGDLFIAYTDGVPDARNASGERFTVERMLALFEKPNHSAATLVDTIEGHLNVHIGDAVQFDDITLLAVRRGHSAERAQPIQKRPEHGA